MKRTIFLVIESQFCKSNIQSQIDTKLSIANAASTYATITEVNTKINDVVGSAPAALDTLKELADALGNDVNYAATTAGRAGGGGPHSQLLAARWPDC